MSKIALPIEIDMRYNSFYASSPARRKAASHCLTRPFFRLPLTKGFLMHIHILTRRIARERGIVRFFPGAPCKNGHIAERNTKSSTCIICDKERKLAERRENPERSREICRKSQEKHREQRRADSKRWREANPELVRSLKRQYVLDNREKVAASKRWYYSENKERYAEICRAWRENNRDKVRLSNRMRTRKIREAGGTHTVQDIRRIHTLQKGTCAACYEKFSGNNYHVDHIQPLALGGSNWPSNLQLLCPPCNMSKGAKEPEEFYRSRGFLL